MNYIDYNIMGRKKKFDILKSIERKISEVFHLYLFALSYTCL